MLKIAVSNPRLADFLLGLPVVQRFFVADLRILAQLRSRHAREAVLERLVMANGVVKTTRFDRFADLDQRTLALFTGWTGPLRVHDVAVSSGTTALRLYLRLREKFESVDLSISDKFARFHLSPGWINAVYDCEGKLIHGYVFGVYADPRISWVFPLSRILFHWLRRRRPTQPAVTDAVLVYDTSVLQALDAGKIKEVSYDILRGAPLGSFDLVRAMNILHTGYFDRARLRTALDHIAATMNEGGVLLVGRSDQRSGINHASFLRKQGPRFVVIENVNNGSDLVTALPDRIISGVSR